MKKNKILLLYVLLELVFFVYFIFFDKQLNLQLVWFSLMLVLIGLYCLLYGYLYHQDSETYYGFLVFFIGIIGGLKNMYNIGFIDYFTMYISSFTLSHLAVFVLFRQKIHFKIFAIFFVICILFLAYKMDYIKLYHIVLSFSFIVVLITLNTIYRIKKNLRRTK